MIEKIFEQEFRNLLKDRDILFPVSIEKDNDKYIIIAEIPGVKKENIEIIYEEPFLKIKVNKEETKKEKILNEIVYGEFERAFEIDNIDKDSIQATYENGILTIEFKEKKENIKKIEIK